MRLGLVFAALAAILSAGAAAAAEPQDKAGSLALVPKESVAFFHIPNLGALEGDLKRFGRETGLVIGHGDHPVLDLLSLRTGIKDGIDLGGSASIGFLDPKKYRERYSVYVLPVADWDALLKATVGEEMSPGLYALTGTAGPRYLARRGRYAVVTSSVRTMDAVASAEGIAGALSGETRARAAGPGPMVYLDVRRLCDIYTDDMTAWFRAASAQLYHQPEALAYADMLSAYLLGIASFLDQTQTLEASIRFEADGVAADVAMRFIKGGAVANFLSAQVPASAAIPLPSDRPVESAVTVSLDPAIRTDLIMKAARFFLAQAPRPEPLPEPTKRQVEEAVQMFAESLGPQMTFISAPAQPGMGAETGLTILELKDPERFRKSLDLLAVAWEALADQLNLYVRFESGPEAEAVAGVPVTVFTPRFRFGIAARHVEFRQRMKVLYGPEGLVYRVAVVGNQAVIASGSDKAMLMQTIERLKGGRAPEPLPAIARLQSHMPARQQVAMAMSLPLFVGQALIRGGTPPDRIGTMDAGQEVAGFALQADGTTARMVSYWPHEQVRLAMDLLKRAAPDMAEMPHTLFEPVLEGPPKPPVPGEAAPAPGPSAPPPGPVRVPPPVPPPATAIPSPAPAPAK
ncbi:MAG: hypothetical protein IMZ44_06985 [Planctomycetes bacterium]|nr:hypothetical protein [Planctomycetota bacterium]